MKISLRGIAPATQWFTALRTIIEGSIILLAELTPLSYLHELIVAAATLRQLMSVADEEIYSLVKCTFCTC